MGGLNPRYTTSEKTEWVLHSIACRAAIKAGDKTHAAQLLRLAEMCWTAECLRSVPGRPIVLNRKKRSWKSSLADKADIIVICGPTATGKTALSVALAKALDGEVVSAIRCRSIKGFVWELHRRRRRR